MGIYSDYIFPHLLELATQGLTEERKSLLEGVRGNVLEIGSGAGQNFPFFSSNVDQAVGLEPSPLSRKKASQTIERIQAEVNLSVVDGVAEKLPWDDGEFDAVISFLVLCSVQDADQALREINRVLKKGGKLFCFEHVLANDAKVAKWQERINPFWKIIGCGCHLNRDTASNIEAAGFELTELQTYRSTKMGPPISSYVIKGYATKV